MLRKIRNRLSKAIAPLLFIFLCFPLMGFEITPPTPSDTEPRRISLRNQSGSAFSKGDLVVVTGFNVTEGLPTADLADKDLTAFRPAMAVVEASVPNLTNFEGLVVGLLTGLDTSSFVINAQLVLGDDGTVSTPPPDTDPFTGEVQMVGSVVRSNLTDGSIYFSLSNVLLPMTAAQLFWTKEIATTGIVVGGNVTRAAGLNVDVALGEGFVNTGGVLFRVSWSAVANLLLTASSTNHIFVDSAGVVQDSVSLPSSESNVILATAITDGSSVVFLSNHKVLLEEASSRTHQYVQDVVGPIAVSGIVTTLNATPLRLDVDTGTFYIRAFRVTVPATAPIGFTYWHRDGSGGFTKTTGQTVIDKDNWDDGTGVLNSLIATEWKKDLLFVAPTSSGAVEYHIFYGQEVFTSQALAEGGNLPSADSDVLDNGIRSSGIVIEGASATIASAVDVRPFLGQLSPQTTAPSDHGLLSGLSDDDHSQYELDAENTLARTLSTGNSTGGTDLQFSGTDKLIGSLGNSVLEFFDVASAVNFIRFTNAATGLDPVMSVSGVAADVDLRIQAKGAGEIIFNPTGGNVGMGGDPFGLFQVIGTPDATSSHLMFGEAAAVSGNPSASLTFTGIGIQNAGFYWTPITAGLGSLRFSAGASGDPSLNTTLWTLRNDGLMLTNAHAPKVARTAVSATTSGMGLAHKYAVTDTTVARTITISSADILNTDREFIIKDESGGAGGATNITIATEGAETIDGASTVTIMVNFGSVLLYSDGTNLFSY